jgi:hypothetical protein
MFVQHFKDNLATNGLNAYVSHEHFFLSHGVAYDFILASRT